MAGKRKTPPSSLEDSHNEKVASPHKLQVPDIKPEVADDSNITHDRKRLKIENEDSEFKNAMTVIQRQFDTNSEMKSKINTLETQIKEMSTREISLEAELVLEKRRVVSLCHRRDRTKQANDQHIERLEDLLKQGREENEELKQKLAQESVKLREKTTRVVELERNLEGGKKGTSAGTSARAIKILETEKELVKEVKRLQVMMKLLVSGDADLWELIKV